MIILDDIDVSLRNQLYEQISNIWLCDMCINDSNGNLSRILHTDLRQFCNLVNDSLKLALTTYEK
jgi:hypothetical protein